MKKGNCDKATKYANCVGGVSGEDYIALLWKDHFNKLYNSVQDHGAKESFFARIKSNVGNFETRLFSIPEIRDAINTMFVMFI